MKHMLHLIGQNQNNFPETLRIATAPPARRRLLPATNPPPDGQRKRETHATHLKLRRDLKVVEQHDENEQVVYRQRLLDDVPRKELERRSLPLHHPGAQAERPGCGTAAASPSQRHPPAGKIVKLVRKKRASADVMGGGE